MRSRSSFLACRVQLVGLAAACGATLSLATVLGYFGQLWWGFDLCSHFRVQYLFSLSVLTLILLWIKRYAPAGIFGACAILNLLSIAPVYFGRPSVPPSKSHVYRGVLLNVNTETGDPVRVGRLIEQTKPDLLALEEINEEWIAALAQQLRQFTYTKAVPRTDNFGIGFFSKLPFKACDVQELGGAEVPSIIADLEFPEGDVRIILTHPLPPGSSEGTRARNAQLSSLPRVVHQVQCPVLVMGDLNTTPWSYTFSRLLADSGLKDSSQGRGILPSWPTFMPPALIPIDHCLYSSGVLITRKALGSRVGSDHYPVIFEFVVAVRTVPARKSTERVAQLNPRNSPIDNSEGPL